MEKMLYRPTELVDLLGCSRSKIYSLISEGEIPHIKVGPRGIRVSAVAIQTWIEKNSSRISEEDQIED